MVVRTSKPSERILLRELARTDWPHIERLFGSRGACGGCWCMHWRVPRGGKSWEAAKGEPNRLAFRKLVQAGQVHGILAFSRDLPVGWCSFGQRSAFPRVDRIKAYRTDETLSVADKSALWSINCFYLAKEYRGQGLSRRLAEAALQAIRKRRGRFVEAYPVTLTRDGKRLPPAFSFTGPESLFRQLGFVEIQRLATSRPLYQMEL